MVKDAQRDVLDACAVRIADWVRYLLSHHRRVQNEGRVKLKARKGAHRLISGVIPHRGRFYGAKEGSEI